MKIILTIISLFLYCIINAQEAAILVKFKNEEILRQSLTSGSKSTLNLRNVSKAVELVPIRYGLYY